MLTADLAHPQIDVSVARYVPRLGVELLLVVVHEVRLEAVVVGVPHGDDDAPVERILAQAVHCDVELVDVEAEAPPVSVRAVEVAVGLGEPRSEVVHEVVQERRVAPPIQHPQRLEEVEERIGVARLVEQHALHRCRGHTHDRVRRDEHVAGTAVRHVLSLYHRFRPLG
jgi:hypothetical protein